MPRHPAARKRATFVLVWLLAQTVVVTGGAYLYASTRNTLVSNGNWVSAKSSLARNVMGAYGYENSRQTLSHERLNLGRWHGHQELLLDRRLAVRKIRFDFRLQDLSYLAFLFHESEGRRQGLLFSLHPKFESALFVQEMGGQFLSSTPLSAHRLAADRWFTLTGHFEGDAVRFELDDRPLGHFPLLDVGKSMIAFRGSENEVLLDDVQVRHGALLHSFHDSFFNRSDFLAAIGWVMLFLIPLNLLLLLRLVRVPIRRVRALGLPAVTVLLFLILGSGLALAAYRVFMGSSYPVALAAEESAWRERELESRTREIRESTTPEPAANSVRVLFVGSSQTWGAGAAREEETLVRQAERLLNQRPRNGRRYECINAGIAGQQASRLLELYRSEWLLLSPDLVVLNFSVNDQDAERFERALIEFLRLNRSMGIRTLFCLEPSSLELPNRRGHLRKIMRRVADRFSVPLADAHAALDARLGSGFLWWDFVHPTSYGHRLIAECLVPWIEKLTVR